MNGKEFGIPTPKGDDDGHFTAPGAHHSPDGVGHESQSSTYAPSTDPWTQRDSMAGRSPQGDGHVASGPVFGNSSHQGSNIWGAQSPDSAPFVPSPGHVTENMSPLPSPSQPSAPHSARKNKGPGWGTVLIAVVISVVLSLGGTLLLLKSNGMTIGAGSTSTSSGVTPQQGAPAPEKPSNTAAVGSDSADWVHVAGQVSPATVTILSEGAEGVEAGSGVIYDASGHVVTNYHVVAMAEGSREGKIFITLSDGRVFPAESVGIDKSTDLAIIKIKNPPSDLSVASFGRSANLNVGQGVMAIGAPLGLSSTVTTGIISALNRPVEVNSPSSPKSVDPNDPFGMLPRNDDGDKQSDPVVTNAIQVDASINPGNSGGPLFDTSGHVIGINFSIASLSSGAPGSQAGSIGLGFAIPSDLVKSVADQILSNGSVDHAVLGVQMRMKPGIAQVDGTNRVGAAIAGVEPDSAAAQGGLQPNDIVISVDGNPVTSGKSLSGYIRRYTGGSDVKIQVVRGGKILDLNVRLKLKK